MSDTDDHMRNIQTLAFLTTYLQQPFNKQIINNCRQFLFNWNTINPWSAEVRQAQTKLPSCTPGGDHQDALILRGWRLSSRIWNPITSPWMKQLTWLRIVHSGD